MAIDTTATATERRIKRRMGSASPGRSGNGRHRRRAVVQEQALAKTV
jgi:hypothetical protein